MLHALALAAGVYASPGMTYSEAAYETRTTVAAVEAANPWPAREIPIGVTIKTPGGSTAPAVTTAAYTPRHSSGSSSSSSSYAPRHASGSYSGSGSMEQCIIARESSGNSQVMNSSGHYGLYQFSASTWAESGGNPADFGNASVSEQRQVFQNAVAARGYSDWTPYDGC